MTPIWQYKIFDDTVPVYTAIKTHEFDFSIELKIS